MSLLGMYAESKPDAAAVIDDSRVVTFAELNDFANRVGNSLRNLGVGPGDKVSTIGYNSSNHFIVSNAVNKIAGTNVPMNYRLKTPEVVYQLNNSDTIVVFAGPEHIDVVETARKDSPNLKHAVAWGSDRVPEAWLRLEDLISEGSPETPEPPEDVRPGLMLYTAGTTGQPKGAVRARGLGGIGAAGSGGTDRRSVFGIEPGSPHLAAGPLYHSAPLIFAGLNSALGGAVVIMRHYEPEDALRLIETHRATWTFMAPTLLTRIVNLPEETKRRYDVSSMKAIICAAAPCPFELKRKVMQLFGPVLFEFYGASETGMNTLMRPEEHEKKPGSCGRVVPGQEIKIVDDDGNECPPGMPGEIWIKAGDMIDEYYKNPEATEEARRGDFFSVGDVGYFDEDGYLYVCDRKRDMIISGGANIYCAEVENVIHAHPKVWDVAVIGIPNEEWGEQVHAIIQPKPQAQITSQEIIAWVGENLADYKKPRSVDFRDDFPRDEAGKIRKRDLREPFWAGRETRV